MSRRSLYVWLAITCLLGGMGGMVLLLLQYEPSPYARALVPEEKRTPKSIDFLREFSEFYNAVQSNDRDWYGRFTDEQINSCLQSGYAEKLKLLSDGIRDPRIVFEDGRMRLMFRYRSGLINTIVSISMRVWLTPTEANVLALKLERFDAGLVPFSAQWLLERIAQTARQNNIDVSWYRHEGYPVALIRFQADQARPTMQLKAVQFEQGKITIQGRSHEFQPGSALSAGEGFGGR